MTPSKAALPLVGTWKLVKTEASRPELPHPASGVTIFAQEGDALRYSNDSVWSDGRTAKVTAIITLDGKWCSLTGSLLSDSVSFKRMADGSYEVSMKKGGADVGTNRTSVSADGRSMTGDWEFAGSGGTTVTWKTVSERQ